MHVFVFSFVLLLYFICRLKGRGSIMNKENFSPEKLNEALSIWGQGDATSKGIEVGAYWFNLGESYNFAATEVVASGYTTKSTIETLHNN